MLLIGSLFVYGNRMRRAFNVYVTVLFVALALLQTAAVTTTHGLVVLTGNLALILVVALTWGWEVVAEKNDFSTREYPLRQVVGCASRGLLAPGPRERRSDDPRFRPGAPAQQRGRTNLLHDDAGGVGGVDAVSSDGDPSVLRVTSFAGMLFGVVNMIVWFGMQPWGWWMGVMDIPLVVISAYAFVLSQARSEKVAPGSHPHSTGELTRQDEPVRVGAGLRCLKRLGSPDARPARWPFLAPHESLRASRPAPFVR